MVQSSPNLVYSIFRGREIQKSWSRSLKINSRTHADRQTKKTKKWSNRAQIFNIDGNELIFFVRYVKILCRIGIWGRAREHSTSWLTNFFGDMFNFSFWRLSRLILSVLRFWHEILILNDHSSSNFRQTILSNFWPFLSVLKLRFVLSSCVW